MKKVSMSPKPIYGTKAGSKSVGQGVANTCTSKGKMK
jgi:hypothetical protein